RLLRVPDHALEVDVGRQTIVLALVEAEVHEGLADEGVEIIDVEAQVLEGHNLPSVDQLGQRPWLWRSSDLQGPALRPDLELLLEVAHRLDRGLVLDLR